MTTPYPPVPGQQPGYGPPPTAPLPVTGGYGYGYPGSPQFARALNPAGLVVALLGGVAVLIGGFANWYSNSAVDVTLGDIVNGLDADGAKALPKAYFSWLMWVMIAATVVVALLASLPTAAAVALRVISPILGALGAVLVFVSLNDLREQGSVFDDSSIGLYLTLFGFVIAGVGGVFGPRRVRLA